MLTVVPVTKVRLILRMPKEWRVEVCVSSKKKKSFNVNLL